MSSSESTLQISGYGVGELVGVVAELQTYKNLLYLFLAFPLGFFYFMLLTFGFTFGTVLSMVVVGIGILIATVAGSRLLARFERWLANALLSVDLERATDVNSSSADGLWATSKRYLDAPSTWRGIGFLLLKFWAGIAGLVLVVLFVSTLSVLTAPVRYPLEVEFVTINDEAITWTIDSLLEAILAVPVGALFAIVLLHLVNAFAYVCERIAEALLGGSNGNEGVATDRSSGTTATAVERPTGTDATAPGQPNDSDTAATDQSNDGAEDGTPE